MFNRSNKAYLSHSVTFYLNFFVSNRDFLDSPSKGPMNPKFWEIITEQTCIFQGSHELWKITKEIPCMEKSWKLKTNGKILQQCFQSNAINVIPPKISVKNIKNQV